MKQEMTMPAKVGILGGTFDPVHFGHLMIAENARTQFELDEILFIPAGPSPHKNDALITDGKMRCEMLELALADNPDFRISHMELDQAEISYTYRTVEKLKQTYPKTEWYFIMGADSLFQFHKWKHPDVILKNATILVAVRDKMQMTELESRIAELTEVYNGKIYPLHTPNFSISSHDIRNRVQRGASIRYQLPDSVLHYIEANRLYQ